ncbi:AraC family transcriptional regulator [Porifericola rhodea]|uniref:helix-turn-helix domain-containing protein n=1 Tax=Porifericola rhodea TaxID=930972 RepID=UPI0026653D11|nr:AraC family transcriptional regulator [Porifericola rhodea]WKN31514.1 AraC family transcriptional regulator [Porifericola rhodea]
MPSNSINITQISHKVCSAGNTDNYVVCWVKNKVASININQEEYSQVSNSIFFFAPQVQWMIHPETDTGTCGYILYIAKEVLDHPLLSNLHINKVRIFNTGEIPLFKLTPGIEKRTQAILEMIDELLGSQLNHKDDAILSLLNTFFIYCDGRCNIKSIVTDNKTKTTIVYKFKKLVDENLSLYHEVADYARLLHISPKYLNECVKEILLVSAKSIIIEQLLIKSRHFLKFSDKSIKEISFELGFSSPEYFSSFFKTHSGSSPSSLRF